MSLTVFGLNATVFALDWIAPTQEELSSNVAKVDPEAGAEMLYRFKQIDNQDSSAPVMDEYIRIKIYNDKGITQLGKVDIPYAKNERIKNLSARVIKPNGQIIDVAKTAFYDREIIKYGNMRVSVRSFSFAGLEPGCIAEYKWTSVAKVDFPFLKLEVMADMPSRSTVFKIRNSFETSSYFYRCVRRDLRRDKDGYSVLELTDVGAAVEEPHMPAVNDAQPWILIYPRPQSSSLYWTYVAKYFREEAAKRLKKNSLTVKSVGLAITQNAATPDEKLLRINDYCRNSIMNLDCYAPLGTVDEKMRSKLNRMPEDVIKGKMGSTFDIQVLFVALAKAVGIDARLAFCANHSTGMYRKEIPTIALLEDAIVAVKNGDKWKFYDPAHRLVNNGKLRWQNSEAAVFIISETGYTRGTTPKLLVDETKTKRTGDFRLTEDGTLLGDVKIEYQGYSEMEAREIFDLQSGQMVTEIVRDRLLARMPGAEVSDVSISDVANFSKPLVLTYSVKIAGYAERSGQRMFLQPGFFSKGLGSLFVSETRNHDVCFNYPMNEEDDISIQVPHWFKLEEGSSPRGTRGSDWGQHAVKISFNKTKNTIIYKRSLTFSILRVPVANYSLVKKIFDFIARDDDHTLTLREGG